MDIDKLYAQFFESKNTSDFLSSGKLADLGLPEINDSLLQNRLEPLSRPILSLEGISSFNLNSIILEVFFFLDRVSTYFAGLFEFDDYSESGSKNPPQAKVEFGNNITPPPRPCKQFNRIKDLFIRTWYFGECYIAYGQGYLNEEKRILKLAQKHRKTTLLLGDIYPNCKWRIYTKKIDDRGEITFTSVISGVEGHKFNPDKLVKCSFGGKGLWLDWFDLAKEWVSMNRSYVQMARLATTKVKANINNYEEWHKEAKLIFGWEQFYLQEETGNTNDIEPEGFCDITDPKEFMHGNMLYISQRMNTLGMVINPTNKAERMTTGEHYKDLKFSSCTESQMLSNLAGICEDCNKNFNTQISVYLTSSLQANGAPKTTQNPYEQFQQGGFDGSFGGQVNNQF